MPDTAAISWYVCRTNPRCEERVCASLDEQGFHVHLPRGVKQVRRRHLRAKQPVVFPLLTGYLFVGLSAETPWFYDLRRTDGVHSVLGRQMDDRSGGTASRYSPVSSTVVEEFRRLESLGTFAEAEEGARLFEPGDSVVVKEGPLEGRTFVFDDYFGHHAAQVMGMMFGTLMPIRVELGNICKAA